MRKPSAVVLVICATFLTAAAQFLLKSNASCFAEPVSCLWTPGLLIGFVCYGGAYMLLLLALRDEELSVVYPFVALGYVWVALLSFLVFQEAFSWPSLLGMGAVVAGVVVVGVSR